MNGNKNTEVLDSVRSVYKTNSLVFYLYSVPFLTSLCNSLKWLIIVSLSLNAIATGDLV